MKTRSMKWPATRERKMTKVFTTPCIKLRVIMSPFEICAISCPRTASISLRLML